MTNNRVPKGLAGGGQFAAGRKAAPTGSLSPEQPADTNVPAEQEYLYLDNADRAEHFRDVLSYGTTTQKLMLCREDDVPHDVVRGLMAREQPIQVRAAAVTSRHPAARELGARDTNPVIRLLSGVLDASDHEGKRARALLTS